ncbi:ABC transporter permease [Candidatus Acetothermia bacterium]|jgi:ABC-type dipeptide/oligopeptide/nickel transport system permease subunit|nr:ABC transporter permease [Candidatus Acetothermia bacterium]MCI2426827.1 ABC transporter permease [Candidatus Acetothermia bacterium]MCI2427786.1 ABC transporter permease [Candidatus Acetothermia bacterium]MCI2428685.1 ABC transporter permease [Candidatus Acetothermia bacterium]
MSRANKSTAAPDSSPRQLSPSQQAWHQLKRNRMAIIGLVIIIVLLLCAIFAPLLTPHDPLRGSLRYARQGVSWQSPLGRDDLGRDILTRILHGARNSIFIGLIAVAIGIVIGVPIGAASGYYGGAIDLVTQRFIDIMLAFPGILLAIAIVSTLGVGLQNVMIAIGIASIPIYVRLIRSSVLTIREQDYIAAAKATGSSDLRIILRHVLPNCIGPLIVQSTLQIATAILWAAGLGFLGLGAQPPMPEWGAMLSRGRVFIRVAPHITIFPGLAIMLSVLGFNLLGDGLRDALDPRMKKI